jgi:hypothetical protein
MRITRCLAALDVTRARELWAGAAGVARHRWQQRLGRRLLFVGALMASVALTYAYVFQEPYADEAADKPARSSEQAPRR